jgi:hypothetical protein
MWRKVSHGVFVRKPIKAFTTPSSSYGVQSHGKHSSLYPFGTMSQLLHLKEFAAGHLLFPKELPNVIFQQVTG